MEKIKHAGWMIAYMAPLVLTMAAAFMHLRTVYGFDMVSLTHWAYLFSHGASMIFVATVTAWVAVVFLLDAGVRSTAIRSMVVRSSKLIFRKAGWILLQPFVWFIAVIKWLFFTLANRMRLRGRSKDAMESTRTFPSFGFRPSAKKADDTVYDFTPGAGRAEQDLEGDWDVTGFLFEDSEIEPNFFQELRTSGNVTVADLASAIQHWLADKAGWAYRPDLILNADMGDKAFEGDGFGAHPCVMVPCFAMNDQQIRLFVFADLAGQSWTVPDFDSLVKGPAGSWKSDDGLEMSCPIARLTQAVNRVKAGFDRLIDEAYPFGALIFPTLVLNIGNAQGGKIHNADGLQRMQAEGLIDIIPFLAPGSVGDALGGEYGDLTPDQLALFQALIEGERASRSPAATEARSPDAVQEAKLEDDDHQDDDDDEEIWMEPDDESGLVYE